MHARAEPAGPGTAIVVNPPGCPAGSFAEGTFLRLLEIELLSEDIHVAKGHDVASATILTLTLERTACETDGRSVVLGLASGRHHGERTITLGDLAVDDRPRALALAVAEVIRSMRAAWQRDDEATAAAPTQPANEAPSPAPIFLHVDLDAGRHPRDPVASATIEGAGAWRVFEAQRTSLLGAQLALRVPLGHSSLHARLDAAGYWTNLSDRWGAVDLSSYSGGFAVLVDVGRRPAFSFGPRLELGYAMAKGSTSAASLSAASGGKMLAAISLVAGLRIEVHGPWALTAEVEGGSALNGPTVMADNRTIATMSGAFGGARAGLAFAY
jgi:hypothetical protein